MTFKNKITFLLSETYFGGRSSVISAYFSAKAVGAAKARIGGNIGEFHIGMADEIVSLSASLLKKGSNTIILFETEGKSADKILFFDTPDL